MNGIRKLIRFQKPFVKTIFSIVFIDAISSHLLSRDPDLYRVIDD